MSMPQNTTTSHGANAADHAAFMRVALTESQKALPACKPNPPVGCALVRAGVVVATGYTQPPYQPHAEPMALAQLEGDDLSDVSAYVTLEPCSFHQRTPSCAKGLIARRIGAVYVAIIDPHPRNQGLGINMLREAGVHVEVGILADEVSAFLSPHLHSGGAEPPMGW